MDKEEIAFLLKVIKAQDKLLMCYKLGGRPPEWVFDIMSKFRELYDNHHLTSSSSRAAEAQRKWEDHVDAECDHYFDREGD